MKGYTAKEITEIRFHQYDQTYNKRIYAKLNVSSRKVTALCPVDPGAYFLKCEDSLPSPYCFLKVIMSTIFRSKSIYLYPSP